MVPRRGLRYASTGVTFPTLDMTQINASLSGMFGFLAPVLFLVGGIGIGGLLLRKAKSFF